MIILGLILLLIFLVILWDDWDYNKCERVGHDWSIVWLTDDLEGYRCKFCGKEVIDIGD